MTDLSTLLSRVESGSGADRELSEALRLSFVQCPGTELLADLNAVIDLVEARHPTQRLMIWRTEDDGWAAHFIDLTDTSYNPEPARALLAALIRAEMEKVK